MRAIAERIAQIVKTVKQRKIKARRIVRSGAICDPLWVLCIKYGSQTSDYVPFQDTDSYQYTPIEWREDWIGA